MPTRVPPNMENPFIVAQRGNRPDPFRPWTPSMPETPSLDGMVGLAKSAQAGLYASIQAPPEQQRQAGPTIRWSPAKQSFYVQGEQFEGRDARMALDTEPLLSQPAAPEPGEGDWIPVPAEQYTAYLESIKNPTRGRLFSQNFDMGVDQLKQLGGSALQAVGAEETGARIVQRAEDRIQQVSPYQREFTGPEGSGRGIRERGEGAALDWFVSVLGNQGPMVLGAVAAALVGKVAGGAAAAGLLATRGGGLVAGNAAMVSKIATTFKRKEYADKVMKAATAYRAGTAGAAEKAILRQAASLTGAAVGIYGNSMVIGTGDIYGEMREQGAEPGIGSSLKAIAMSVPYAFLETLTEFFIFKRVLGVGGRTKADWGKGVLAKTGEGARRLATGVTVYGTGEAMTEGAQEILVMGMSGQNLLDDAAIERYINGMAAGFAVGGFLGGPANLRSRYEPADLMQNDGKEETPPPATPPAAPVGEPTVELPSSSASFEFTAPGATEFSPPSNVPLSLDTAPLPGLTEAAESSTIELAPTNIGQQTGQAPTQFSRAGLALGISPRVFDQQNPPIPEGQRFGQSTGDTQMFAAMQRAQSGNAFLQAQRQQTTRKEAEFTAAEQVNLLTPEERAVVDQQPEQAQLPMAQERVPADRSAELAALQQEAIEQNRGRAPAAQLRQMAERITLPPEDTGSTQPSLFNQRQTPRPSRADRLRRGIDRSQQAEQELLGQARETARDIALDAQQKGAQGSLLTQKGEPTVAALKSAGERVRRPQPVVEPSEPQTRPARGLKKKAAAKKPEPKSLTPQADKTYIEDAKAAGYNGSDASLIAIGMGIERGQVAWQWYESGDDKYDVAGMFNEGETPTEKAVVMAYAEGMAGEYKDVTWTDPDKPTPTPPKPKTKKPLKKAAEAKPKSPAGERLKKATAAAKQKEKTDAVQKRSAAKVDAREQAEAGTGVRGQDTKEQEPARASRAEEKPQESKPAVQQKQVVQKVVAKDAKERWEDDYDFPYERIPDDLREQWEDAFAKGKATSLLAQSIYTNLEFTPLEEMQNAVQMLREGDPASFEYLDAVKSVINNAFFETDAKEDVTTEARLGLQEASLTSAQLTAVHNTFIDQAEQALRRDAFKNKKPQPWFSYAQSHGLLSRLPNLEMRGIPKDLVESLVRSEQLKHNNLPESVWGKLPADLRGVVPKDKGPQISKGRELTNLIEDTNDSRASRNAEAVTKLKTKLTELWEDVQEKGEENLQTRYNSPLKDYFDEDGTPRVFSINGRPYISNVALTDAQQLSMEKIERGASRAKEGKPVVDEDSSGEVDPDVERAERAERKRAAGEPILENSNYETWSSGRAKLATTDGTPIAGPLPRLKLRKVLSNFVKRAFMRPKFWIFSNVADLKARNPELYKQAKKARDLVRHAVTTIKTKDANGKSVTVYINPDPNLIRSLAQASKDKGKVIPFRYLLDDRGDFYVWDANNTLHEWMVEPLRKLNAKIGNRDRGVGEGWIRYHREGNKVNRFQYDVDTAEQAANDTTIPDLPYDPPPNVTNDFDTMEAAGYSFESSNKLKKARDASVILFSDYLYTKQQAAFVMAHETMGHFGLRGFIPQDKFDGIMSGIYRDNPAIRQDVDAAMNANKKLGLAEAVEEHLSDYAATLDTSIIARIWNALKNVLNDMGVKFGDESMRYLVHQARRYVREGKTANAFELQQVFDKLYEVEYGTTLPNTGRFALTTPGMMDPQFADDMRLFGNPNIADRSIESFEDGMKELRKMKLNFSESWDKFKARFFSLSNFRALSNPGLYSVVSLLEGMRNMSHSIKTIMNETLKPVMNKAIAGAIGGISKEQTATISNMLYHGRDWAIAQLRDNPKLTQDDKPLMYFDENGGLQRALSADGKSTLVNELGAAGTITFEMMKNGFSYTIIDPDGEGTKKTEIKVPGVKNLTKTSLEWTGYKMLREAVTEVETLLLIAQYIDASEVRKSAVNEVASLMINERLTRADRDYIKLVMDTYRDIKVEAEVYDAQGMPTFNKDASDAAYKFIELLNKAVIGQKTDRIADLSKFMKENPNYFKGKLPDDIMSGLDKFRERVSVTENSENKFVLQDKIKAVVLSELARNRHDKATRTSIIAGYTPILREGKAQVRLLAVDAETGQPVRLAQSYRDRFIYSMFDNPADAKEMADYLNIQLRVDKEGNPKTYEALAYNHELRKETMRKVRLVAVAEQAKTNLSAPPQLNLNEFIRGLHFFDLQISPVKMEHIITTMTTQNSKMRQRLQYSGNPGFDRTSGIAAIARHIESRASTIAKTMYRSRTADAMNMRLRSTQQMWYATEQVDVRDPVTGKVDTIPKVEHLKNIMDKMFADPDAPFAAKRVAQQEYLRYKFMVDQTNKHDLKQGNKFYNEAAETLAFLDNNESIEESNFASGKTISRIRAFTSMAQLGMSLATGSLNLIALGTNSLPYLASMNSETGFGGGFGMGPSVAAMNTAMAQVGAPGMNPATEGGRNYNLAQFYAEIAGDTRNIADPKEAARIKAGAAKLQAKYGLQAHEAQFLADEIRAGVMIPALSNSLVGQARGLAQSGIQQHFIDKWMMFFNLTEQASRRTLGLAAYRLQYAQQIAAMQEAGKDLTAEQIAIAQQQAKRFAVDAIQHTLGEYSVLNRPPVWRGGVQSLMYMYKVFPTTSIQLLRRMSKGGQAAMLASLWIMGGLMATPFAEDIEDLIDTLAQAIGWRKGSIRFEIAKALDEFVPGLSPWALGGLVNSFMTGNVATRTSLGDFWPGSGVLLAGSDVGRELIDIGGPIPSALLGVGRSLADLARWPTSPTPGRSFLNIMREAPVTMVRAAGDAYTYAQSGVITDKRGYVVSKDVTKMTIAARLMGFYPVAASQQYDIIRMAKRMTDYQKDTVAGFRTLWIQAYASGDMASVRAVDNAVADWNRATRGTGMEIRNFRANSMRAYRESRREGVDRLRKGAPRPARGDIDRMQDLATYND